MEKVVNVLKTESNITEDISMIPYLFGFEDNQGLNHILIELKKELFYIWNVNIEVDTVSEQFLAKIKKIIRKEYHAVKKIS